MVLSCVVIWMQPILTPVHSFMFAHQSELQKWEKKGSQSGRKSISTATTISSNCILIALRCDEASCTSTTTCNIVPNHLAVVWQVFHPKFYWAACSPIIH